MKRLIPTLLVLFALGCIVLHCIACSPAPLVMPAAYEAELTTCNQQANTLVESITCENGVRARYKRPLRMLPGDGGVQ